MKHLLWLTRDRTVGVRRAPSVLDWLLAFALIALALIEVASGAFPGPVVLAAVVQPVWILPLAFRRLAPVAAITVATLVSLPYSVVYGAGNSLAGAAAFLVFAYAVGRYSNRRVLPVGIAMGLLMIVELWIGGRLAGLADIAYLLIFYGAALGLGVALRAQVRRSTVLEAVADRAEREKEAMAQAAVLEERARIARELHDVVAHNVGLIVLQAGGARSVLDADPERARTALQQVEETGRQTLSEMRHLVGILRVDDAADLQPLPRLERLPVLIDEARAGGLTVEMAVEGTPVDLPAGLELAAFRLVQEALTNVIKHAPGSHVQVRLGYESDRLRIEVIDDGVPRGAAVEAPQAPAGAGQGHGLIGMRERVLLYDGRFQTGPTPAGGFRIEAILPLAHTSA